MATLVQAILPSVSGIPKDSVVNTFHFVGDPMDATEIADCTAALESFYDDIAAGRTQEIAHYLSSSIARGASAIKFKFFSTVVAGVGPYAETTGSLTDAGSSGFPSEVAACLSYKQAGAVGAQARRQRGRIYIGPMNNASYELDANNVPMVKPDCYNDILGSGVDLRNWADGATWGPWVVHSTYGSSIVPGSVPPRMVNPPDVQTDYPIDYLWVDNAYDTQRRRGEKATTRAVADLT